MQSSRVAQFKGLVPGYILSIIIVLFLLLLFTIWFYTSILALFVDPFESLKLIIPGVIFYGFWALVVIKLWDN